MKLCDATKDYINFLRTEQGATEKTVITYQCWLNRYGRWLTEEGLQSDEIDIALTVPQLRRFQYDLEVWRAQWRGGSPAYN